jgi:hypothetical protein
LAAHRWLQCSDGGRLIAMPRGGSTSRKNSSCARPCNQDRVRARRLDSGHDTIEAAHQALMTGGLVKLQHFDHFRPPVFRYGVRCTESEYYRALPFFILNELRWHPPGLTGGMLYCGRRRLTAGVGKARPYEPASGFRRPRPFQRKRRVGALAQGH